MTDDLDTKTDAQLSEIFAVEIAGLVKSKTFTYEGEYSIWLDKKGHVDEPNFATSADAVLPWLEKERLAVISCNTKGWRVEIVRRSANVIFAYSDKIARAACIALIRATRARKGAIA